MSINVGKEYLDDLRHAQTAAEREFDRCQKTKSNELFFIGTSLSALYQAATCYRKCWDNGHLLESLSGRAHNLGCAAMSLTRIGLYDEALNLVRSLAEITNLVGALSQDKTALRRWIEALPKDRKKEFQPVKVRELLRETQSPFLVATDDWYKHFCEAYTHVTPHTRPGDHGREENAWIGPVFQEQGVDKALTELADVMVPLAMMICAYFKFDDILNDFEQSLDKLS